MKRTNLSFVELPTVYEQLVKLCEGTLKDYRNDLLVHDKDWLSKHPNVDFIHICRASGTHIVDMPNKSEYPEKGIKIPYLFGVADRNHLVAQKLECTKTLAKLYPNATYRLIRDNRIKVITSQEAISIVNNYCKMLQKQFETEHS